MGKQDIDTEQAQAQAAVPDPADLAAWALESLCDSRDAASANPLLGRKDTDAFGIQPQPQDAGPAA